MFISCCSLFITQKIKSQQNIIEDPDALCISNTYVTFYIYFTLYIIIFKLVYDCLYPLFYRIFLKIFFSLNYFIMYLQPSVIT